MQKYDRAIGEMTLVCFLGSSDQTLEPWVRDKIRVFLAAPRTALEMYEFSDEIARIECVRHTLPGGQRVAVGYISAFMQAVLDVKNVFLPPDADEPKLVNIAEIESRFHCGGDACGVPDVDDLGYVD